MIQCCWFFIMYRTWNSVFGADAGQLQELIIRVLWFRVAFPQLGVFRGSFLSVLKGRWQCAVLSRPHRNWVSGCVGGIPSIEFTMMGLPFQIFERYWSHIQVSQDLIRRISRISRRVQNFRCLRFWDFENNMFENGPDCFLILFWKICRSKVKSKVCFPLKPNRLEDMCNY